MARKLLTVSQTPKNDVPSIMEVPAACDLIEHSVHEALKRISPNFGIHPPKVRIYTDFMEFTKARSVLNAETKAHIDSSYPPILTFDEKVGRFIREGMFSNSMRGVIGNCSAVTVPGSDLDAIIWIKPGERGNKFNRAIIGESTHAIVHKIEKLLGHMHPNEMDETLDFTQEVLSLGRADRKAFLRNMSKAINAVESMASDIKSSPTMLGGKNYVASKATLHSIELFTDDQLKDVIVIMAVTGNILSKNDSEAVEKITRFLDDLAKQEAQRSGYLRETADQFRAILRSKDSQ